MTWVVTWLDKPGVKAGLSKVDDAGQLEVEIEVAGLRVRVLKKLRFFSALLPPSVEVLSVGGGDRVGADETGRDVDDGRS